MFAACSVVTGNTNGYLARHDDGQEDAISFTAVQTEDNLLRPGTYFYCLIETEGREIEG